MENLFTASLILSNREIALLIWFVLFIGWAFSNPGVRESFFVFLRKLFDYKILLLFLALFTYIAVVVYLLAQVGFWEFSLMKGTIYWLFGTAIVLLFGAASRERRKDNFLAILKGSFTVTVLIEFVVNLHSFNLVVELILIPITSILVMMAAVAETKTEFATAERFLGNCLTTIGCSLIVAASIVIATSYQSYINFGSFKSFFLPIILNILLIPFIYLFMVYTTYELLFVRLFFLLNRDEVLVRNAKREIIWTCKWNLRKLDSFSKMIAPELVNGPQDQMFQIISRILKTC